MTSEQLTTVTHVVFDMDGLLLDTEPRYEKAISTVCERHGAKYGLDLRLRDLGMTGKDSAQLITSELNLGITSDQYMLELDHEYLSVFDKVPFMPGAEQLVRHLNKHNIPIAIATSSNTQTFEMKTKHLKEFFKLFHHILFCSEEPDVKKGKPAPDSYKVCVSRFDDKPESMKNVLVLEDSPAGVRSGLSAGCQVVWVPEPVMPRHMARPTLILNSLTEFCPELFGLPPFET